MGDSEDEEKPELLTSIFPDGGVILVVGPEKVRLRIAPDVLRSASKPFTAMFSSTWAEGRNMSTSLPVEIPLPEDDADAMWAICCVLHHRNDHVPTRLSTKRIFKIALLADKYDLIVALQYSSEKWLRPRHRSSNESLFYMFASALLFGNADMVMAHSANIILSYEGSYLKSLDNELLSRAIPPRAIRKQYPHHISEALANNLES